jgi:hypothetical protein
MALPSRNHRETHEVYIWFVLDGDGLYVGAANLNRQWVRNVQKTPKIRLSHRCSHGARAFCFPTWCNL